MEINQESSTRRSSTGWNRSGTNNTAPASKGRLNEQ